MLVINTSDQKQSKKKKKDEEKKIQKKEQRNKVKRKYYEIKLHIIFSCKYLNYFYFEISYFQNCLDHGDHGTRDCYSDILAKNNFIALH